MHAVRARGFLIVLSVVFSSACSQSARQNAADADLRAIYTAEWTWRQAQFPDDENEQKPIADSLPKVDPPSQDMRLHHWEDVLGKLDAVHLTDLSPRERLNYEVYRPQIEALIANQRFRDFEMPANSDTTFWTDLGYTARRPFRTPRDYRNWLAQMRDIPRYFHEQMDEMRAGAKRGFTPPRITMEGRNTSLTAVTEAAPESSLFYTPFLDIPGVAPAEQIDLRAQAVKVIRDVVQPAYVELLHFMRTEYVPATRTTLAAQDLPDGRKYYLAKIREFTTLDMEPEAIHALGMAEVARLRDEMVVAMRDTGFKGDMPAFLAFPAFRSALLRQDSGRAVDARGLDRQAFRR